MWIILVYKSNRASLSDLSKLGQSLTGRCVGGTIRQWLNHKSGNYTASLETAELSSPFNSEHLMYLLEVQVERVKTVTVLSHRDDHGRSSVDQKIRCDIGRFCRMSLTCIQNIGSQVTYTVLTENIRSFLEIYTVLWRKIYGP